MKISNNHDVTVTDIIRYILRPKDEVKQQREDDHTVLIASAAFSGFVSGFVAALLLAPESGAELRQDLSKLFHEANNRITQLVSEKIENMI
jgi:hypothetical protein